MNLSPAHRVKTLAHELAHALLHVDVTDRGLKELEAESVAFVVCHAIGIASDNWSFGYVAGWAGGGDEAKPFNLIAVLALVECLTRGTVR